MISDLIDIGKCYEFSPVEGYHAFIGKVGDVKGNWVLVWYEYEGVKKTSLINTDNITLITQVPSVLGGNR